MKASAAAQWMRSQPGGHAERVADDGQPGEEGDRRAVSPHKRNSPSSIFFGGMNRPIR